jgi:hypothetical protein
MNPKPKLPLKDSLQQPLPPKEEAEAESHHSSNDVDTNTAFKFLLAGGIAGAGSYRATGSRQHVTDIPSDQYPEQRQLLLIG